MTIHPLIGACRAAVTAIAAGTDRADLWDIIDTAKGNRILEAVNARLAPVLRAAEEMRKSFHAIGSTVAAKRAREYDAAVRAVADGGEGAGNAGNTVE